MGAIHGPIPKTYNIYVLLSALLPIDSNFQSTSKLSTFSVLAWHSSIVFFAECTFESVQFAVQIKYLYSV